MSTLYVLSLRTEEDLVETDGYVPGGPAAAKLPGQAGLRWAAQGQRSQGGCVLSRGFPLRVSACWGLVQVGGKGSLGGEAVFPSSC